MFITFATPSKDRSVIIEVQLYTWNDFESFTIFTFPGKTQSKCRKDAICSECTVFLQKYGTWYLVESSPCVTCSQAYISHSLVHTHMHTHSCPSVISWECPSHTPLICSELVESQRHTASHTSAFITLNPLHNRSVSALTGTVGY